MEEIKSKAENDENATTIEKEKNDTEKKLTEFKKDFEDALKLKDCESNIVEDEKIVENKTEEKAAQEASPSKANDAAVHDEADPQKWDKTEERIKYQPKAKNSVPEMGTEAPKRSRKALYPIITTRTTKTNQNRK